MSNHYSCTSGVLHGTLCYSQKAKNEMAINVSFLSGF